MKTTRVNVEEFATSKGFEPIEVDGIPDGFAWKMPDITIGGKEHIGAYVAFIPLSEWDSSSGKVVSDTVETLLELYNKFKK